jgi:superfamily II DNA or RNA helicase
MSTFDDPRLSLRPYQAEVIAQFGAAIAAGKRRVLIVAPTGAGKTILAVAIILDALRQGKRVQFLAHLWPGAVIAALRAQYPRILT